MSLLQALLRGSQRGIDRYTQPIMRMWREIIHIYPRNFCSNSFQLLLGIAGFTLLLGPLLENVGASATYTDAELPFGGLYLVFTIVAAVGWRQWYGTDRSAH